MSPAHSTQIMMKKICLLSLLAACVIDASVAAPAPWYKWRSKLTGEEVCAQFMQGDWELASGPYSDPLCRKRGAPG